MKPEDFMGASRLKEHISPEGVEEKVVLEIRQLMTQTAGGKFRLYGWNPTTQKYTPQDVFDEFDAARMRFGNTISLIGLLFANPKATVDAILGILKPIDGDKRKKD